MANTNRKKIIYFYPFRSSFVSNDISFLSEKYDVKEFQFNPQPKSLAPVVLLKQFIFIVSNLFSANMFICMFGGYHSFLPSLLGKLFGKPCLVIVGGTDCVSFPSINYGNFNKKILGMFTRATYKYAARILPVNKSLVLTDYTYQDEDFKQQGYKFFCPEITTPFTEIHYGFDPDKWIESKEKTPNSFITVAVGLDKPFRVKLKGIDLILEVAPFFPDVTFTIIGCPDDYKLNIRSSNIKTYSYVSNELLKDIYNKHEYYIQVSMSEGFPNAICEAMTCGCIPIGSIVGAMPDIIGDAGFLLKRRDAGMFKELIAEALSCDKKKYSEKARQRIMTQYPKDLRKDQLMDLIKSIIGE